MISWSNRLFISKNIKKSELLKLKDDIEKNKLTKKYYCITFALNPKNLFEIYNTKQFIIPYYQKQKFHILGVAESKKKAFKLVSKMLVEIYEKTDDFKVREYFS